MTTLRSDADDAARRSYIGVSRATIVQADDAPRMQEVSVRARFGEQFTNVEHWHPYGETSVPLPPDQNGEAEALIAFLGGSPDHPVVIATADRRYRPKNLKSGDRAWYDFRGQKTVFSAEGITHTTTLTITHNTVDGQGSVTTSVVQDPSGKVTIKNKAGATIVMDAANITTQPGPGGKHIVRGDVSVEGGINATKTIAGVGGVISQGLAVKTT